MVNKPLQSPLVSSSLMTPRTFKLYAFGETPSGKLDEVSNVWNSQGLNRGID